MAETGSALFVCSCGKWEVKRCSEDSEMLVESVNMFVAPFNSPFVGAVGQLDVIAVNRRFLKEM